MKFIKYTLGIFFLAITVTSCRSSYSADETQQGDNDEGQYYEEQPYYGDDVEYDYEEPYVDGYWYGGHRHYWHGGHGGHWGGHGGGHGGGGHHH